MIFLAWGNKNETKFGKVKNIFFLEKHLMFLVGDVTCHMTVVLKIATYQWVMRRSRTCSLFRYNFIVSSSSRL